MRIQCRNAHVLHQWSTNDEQLHSGAVLVEFTVHDNSFDQPFARKLVEYVSIQTDPEHPAHLRKVRLEKRAFEQVVAYFDGAGGRENLFSETPEPASAKRLLPGDEINILREAFVLKQEFQLAV